MRDRQTIESDCISKVNDLGSLEGMQLMTTTFILEVLLDIRDLLPPQENKAAPQDTV